MSAASRVVAIVVALAVFAVLFELIRRRRLKERHAIFWIALTASLLLIGVFPGAAEWLAASLGFELPSNLLFFFSIAVLFAVAVQTSVEIARTDDRIRSLAEEVALLRREIERVSLEVTGDRGARTDDHET